MLKQLAMLWLLGVGIVVTVYCYNQLLMITMSPAITSSIEAKSCEVFIAHRGIYVKCVSIIVYAHNFLLDKNTIRLK